jgi:hypothetical protein
VAIYLFTRHRSGPANVSLIDTTGGGAGEFIGSFLKTFDDFCPTSGETPADRECSGHYL